jgi:hypothetical protein
LFTGAVDDPNTVQLHDFEPGIAQSGLFWTIPVPFWSIEVDPISGRARMRGRNVPVGDYHDFLSAIAPGATSVRSHVSFDVVWPGHGGREKIRDTTFKFSGTYVKSATTISFTASDDHSGVVYTSDPDGQFNPSTEQLGSGSPAVGLERNGRFFR